MFSPNVIKFPNDFDFYPDMSDLYNFNFSFQEGYLEKLSF